MRELKQVYQVSTKEMAEEGLKMLASKWQKKYLVIIASWRDDWEKSTTYFSYTPAIQKLIYTMNPIENCHRQIRKVTNNKGVFTSDRALLKLVY